MIIWRGREINVEVFHKRLTPETAEKILLAINQGRRFALKRKNNMVAFDPVKLLSIHLPSGNYGRKYPDAEHFLTDLRVKLLVFREFVPIDEPKKLSNET